MRVIYLNFSKLAKKTDRQTNKERERQMKDGGGGVGEERKFKGRYKWSMKGVLYFKG